MRTLLAATFPVLLLCSTVRAEQYPWTVSRISVREGLSQSSVFCIFQDAQGFVWFGTGDGLDRFDGSSFTVFRNDPSDTNSLSDNTIRNIAEAPDGMLWIQTEKGTDTYDRRRGTIRRRFPPGAMMLDSSGNVWLGGQPGLRCYNPSTGVLRKYAEGLVFNFFPGRGGKIFVTIASTLLVVDRNGQITDCGSRLHNGDWPIRSLYEDTTGVIWLGTQTGRLFSHDPVAGTTRQYIAADTVATAGVFCILPVRPGLLLVGTGRGLLAIDTRAQRLVHPAWLQEVQWSLESSTVRSIAPERSGVTFIGTDGEGVLRVQPPRFLHIRNVSGETNSPGGNFIRAITEDVKGTVWVGTVGHGLDAWNRTKGTWIHYTHSPSDARSIRSNGVYALHADSTGTIWVGTDGGLDEFNPHTTGFVHHSAPGNAVLAVQAIQPYGRQLLLGTTRGVLSFDPATKTFEHVVDSVQRGGTVWVPDVVVLSTDTRNRLWIGRVLFVFNAKREQTGTFAHDDHDTTSLSHDFVNVIHEDRAGRIWIGTARGLNRFNGTDNTFTHFDERNGLPGSCIYAMLDDDRGNIWISTNRGLTRFTPDATPGMQCRNYTVEDGLQSDEFNTGSCYRNSRGEMLFGGVNGINVFHPDSIGDNMYRPPVVITGFKKFDQPYETGTDPTWLTSVGLTHEDDVFSFTFAALAFVHPHKNRYAYRLEGFEESWVYCGDRREARYTHIPPGRYTFRVKASNEDGIWNEAGVAVDVTIAPPFWMRFWFVSLCAVTSVAGGALIVRGVIRRRVRKGIEAMERQQALDRERLRISRDMHDDVGSSITKIAILSEIALQREQKGHPERELKDISVTAREVIDNISEIIWALNPKNDRAENLIGYIREYTTAFFEGMNIRCTLDIPPHIPDCSFPPEVRRNIFLTVKETLQNVAKHSSAKECHVTLCLRDGRMVLVCRDDGHGFDPAAVRAGGNGLQNMTKRMADIGGNCTIMTGREGGTTVTMTFPPHHDLPRS